MYADAHNLHKQKQLRHSEERDKNGYGFHIPFWDLQIKNKPGEKERITKIIQI